jgi:FkbM family methyltransferase
MTTVYYNKNPIKVTQETLEKTPITFNKNGYFEPNSIHYFFNIAHFHMNNKILNIVDIGAQSGLYSLYAKYLPESTFYSFEPNPETFKLLEDNCKLNNISNINLFNIGLSDISGNLSLKVPSNPEEKGLCCFSDSPLRFTANYNEYLVEVSTLDDLFFYKNIKVDMIKCDTEGWEFYILKGGEKTLKTYKPELFIEINDINMKQCRVIKTELIKFLEDLGYILVKIVDNENYHFRTNL